MSHKPNAPTILRIHTDHATADAIEILWTLSYQLQEEAWPHYVASGYIDEALFSAQDSVERIIARLRQRYAQE